MIRTPIAMLLMVTTSACSLAPAYVRPASPVPASWPVGDAYLRTSEATLPAVTYQDIFRDPRLQQLIAQAIANNRDLRLAAANIASAQAQYRIRRADLLPGVDAGASVATGDRGTARTGGGTGAGSGTTTSYTADIGVTAFEIDLFGRVASLSEAARDRYFATEAGARATRLALVGNLATAWLNHAADSSLLNIAQRTAENARKSVRLTNARLKGGIAPRTDLRQAELVLDTALSDVARLTTQVAQDANAVQLLVGAPVAPALLPESIETVEASLGELPAGLGSDILLRRPDVVQAEYQLRAANASIGAARAALFPRISLTALAGVASTALSSLFTGGAFTWSVAPSASVPIFDGGAARSGVAQARADADAAVATYEKTVQTAFREVADALARRGTIDDQLAADRHSVAAARDNYTLSDARYRGGISSFLESLTAQRSLYAAERSLVQTRLARATNLARLYQVLGGDSLLTATARGPAPAPGPASKR